MPINLPLSDESAMTTETLQRAIHAQPFRPFTLHLADQRTLTIPHPDFIAHRPGGRIAVVIQQDDFAEYVDLLLVVSLEFGAPATAPAGQPR
jgi:hypothetical protein